MDRHNIYFLVYEFAEKEGVIGYKTEEWNNIKVLTIQ